MAMMAGSRVFIDTNILVYANLGQSPFHSLAVARLQELQDNDCSLYATCQLGSLTLGPEKKKEANLPLHRSPFRSAGELFIAL